MDDVAKDIETIKSEINAQFKVTVKTAQYQTATRYSAHLIANIVVDLELQHTFFSAINQGLK